MHRRYIDSPHFDHIKSGKKISEAHINRSVNNFEKGHTIKYSHSELDDHIHLVVLGVSYYKNFEDMLLNEMINVLPDVKSLEEGLKHYRSIHTNRAEEERLGVIVVHFEVR